MTGDAPAHPRVRVPFIDLTRIDERVCTEILADVADLLDTGRFTNGAQVARFEDAFAAYCGASHCVGVGNGLDGLRLGLQALGVGPGDEVIVPAQTFVATWEAVSQVGATPVPVDVSDHDYDLDPELIEAAVTERTRCIVPVDLFGQLADAKRVREVADRLGLAVVEDACQAHGARRDGSPPGAFADLAVFSFYPSKNLGAAGDAGAVVTDDAELAERLRMLREHGQRRKYAHDVIGWTSRLDTIQAAVLLRKLPHLDGWNRERREVASRFLEALDGVGDLRLPRVPAGSEPVWHVFVVLSSRPDALLDFLRGRGVDAGRHYPSPPHLTEAYRSLGYAKGSFPAAERIADSCVSLPIFPGMTDAEVDAVTSAVTDYFD